MTRISVAICLDPRGLPFIDAALDSCAGADEIVVMHDDQIGVRFVAPDRPGLRSLTANPADRGNIGALKRAAFGACAGDAVIELDHDDVLAPGAIEKVRAAFDAGADFVYSDFAEFHDGTYAANAPYQARCGWTHYPEVAELGGALRGLTAMRAPPMTAQNVRSILFAPNHLRAWRRDFYEQIGGHARDLKVADDHDLLVRTYLAGAYVMHLPECLYYYRVHAAQTVQTRNAEIQDATASVWDRHREAIALEYCERNGLLAIDLCGGPQAGTDWTSYDLQLGDDMNERWKISDGVVGAVRANDALEHLRDPIHTWKELHRVLAPGGFLLSSTPSTDGRGAWQDPTHVSFWNSNSFWYVTRQEQQHYVPALAGVRFAPARVRNHFPTPWHKLHNIPYVQADLIKLGPGYDHMGLVEI